MTAVSARLGDRLMRLAQKMPIEVMLPVSGAFTIIARKKIR
jgi:hypothetical protein